MKKIYSFLMAFAALATTASAQQVTNLDQLDNNKVYTITAGGGRGSFYYNGTTQFVRSTGKDGVTLDAANPNHKFAICKENGKYYLISIGAQKYVTGDNKSLNGGAPLVNEPAEVTLQAGTGVPNSWVFTTTATGYQLAISNSYTYGVINTWNDITDVGNCMTITAVEGSFDYAAFKNKTAVVTYEYKVNGELKRTENHTVMKGDAFPAYTLPYGVESNTVIDGTVAGNVTKVIDCTISTTGVPFYATKQVDGKWFAYGIRSGANYAYYNGEKVVYNKNSSAIGDCENNKFFQLVGNPFDGFNLYNKAVEMPLTTATVANQATFVPATDVASARKFYLTKVEKNGVVYFNLRETTNANGYLNAYANGGDLSYWVDAAAKEESGSNFKVVYLEDLYVGYLSEAQAWVDGHKNTVGQPGSMDQTSFTTLDNLVKKTNSTEAEYKQAILDIQSAIDNIQPAEVNGVFTFQSFVPNNNSYANLQGYYMSDSEGTDGKLHVTTGFDGAQKLWEVKKMDDGRYSVRNLFTNKYLGNPTQSKNDPSDTEVGLVLKLSKTGGSIALKHATANEGHHFQVEGAKVVGWDYTSPASQWTIKKHETLTVNVGEAMYATFSAPFATTIPAGIEAYTGTKTGNSIQLTKVEGGVLPANTGVLLKAAEAKAYDFVMVEDETPALTNAFTVSLKKVAKPAASIYTLQNQEELGVAFYPYNGANLDPFKAYIAVPAESGVQAFTIDFGGVTAIEGAAVESGKLEMFDLQGRRVNNAKSGLYIVNGKKVVL